MICEKCWHFRAKYRFCDFLGRDIEVGEIESPADCCWFDERNAKEEEDEKMTREHFLDEAKKCVCTDREGQYGAPEDNFGVIAEFWDSYLKSVLNLHEYDSLIDSVDVAVMMALLKIARISTGKLKADNWVDLIGYASCGGEIQFKEG